MRSFFELDSPYCRLVTKIVHIIYLNILWLLFSLPVITIGASTTALYYVAMKLVKNEDGYIARSFIKSFRMNFRQGTIIWIIMLAAGFVLLQDFRYFNYMDYLPGKIGFALVLVLYGLVVVMVFPVLAKYDNTIRNTLKNTLYFAFRHLSSSAALLVMLCAVGYGFYSSAIVMMLFFLCGGAVLACGGAFMLNHIFSLYIRRENKYEQES